MEHGATDNISEDQATQQILNSPSIELLDPREPAEEVQSAKESSEEVSEETEETSEEPKQEATQPETEVVEIDPEVDMFNVDIKKNGELVETKTLSLNELKDGYKRHEDYTREVQSLADQRDSVKAEVRQGIEQSEAQYRQALEVQQKLVWEIAAQEFQGVNFDELANDDPAEYIKVSNRLNKFNQSIQGIQTELQRVAQSQVDHINNEILPKTRAEIKRDLPNWTDDMQIAIGKTYGFAPEEVTNIPDPRMVKILHDAHQYQKIKAQKPISEKKVTAKPKVVRPGTKGTKQVGESVKRAKQTGKLHDAAAAILESQF